MNQMKRPYVAPLLSVLMLEEINPLCGSQNKSAGTIGGNGSQTSEGAEHASYGGADPGAEASVDAKSWGGSDWDEWE